MWMLIPSRKSSLIVGMKAALPFGRFRPVKVKLAVWRVRVKGLT